MRYFEDFRVGEKFISRQRIITHTDVEIFAGLTGDVHPLFLSEEHARRLGFKGRLVPGLLTLACSFGLLFQVGLFDATVAMVGLENVRFTSPVRPGESIRVEAEVVEKRETRDPRRGLIRIRFRCRNVDEDRVCVEGEIIELVQKKLEVR